MAQGWQSATQCFETIELAASHMCGSVSGVTGSGGLLTCSGFTVVGEEVELTLSSGSSTPWTPMQCQRHDWQGTWGPLYGAILVAVVSVWVLRKLADMFRTNHEV